MALSAQEIYKSVDAEGHEVFSDRPPPGAETSTVALDAQAPPRVLHFCWTNCFTLRGEDGVYARTDGTDESWTVERFTPNAFVLHRRDAPAAWNGFHADVIYAGEVANDRLINVTVDGRPVSEIQAAWGTALDILPGTNAERDRLIAQGWSFPPADAAMDGVSAEPPLTATEAPPPLPDEEQPVCSVVGSVWTPGYWGWTTAGYYWVRGAWVRAPHVGWLWTPGYWELVGGVYVFHPGHWGAHVGYYGGINYGYGYFGSGYSGGHWAGGKFLYNTAVSHVDTGVIHDTYREPVGVDLAPSRVSYRSGSGGTTVIRIPREHVASPEPAQARIERATRKAAARHTAGAGAHALARSTSSSGTSSSGTSRRKVEREESDESDAASQRALHTRVTASELQK